MMGNLQDSYVNNHGGRRGEGGRKEEKEEEKEEEKGTGYFIDSSLSRPPTVPLPNCSANF